MMKFKIIDFSFFGNVIQLYLGSPALTDWTGEDWDYEATESVAPVDPTYVLKKISIVVNPEKFVVETFEDEMRESFSKNDMKTNGFPFVSITKNYGCFWAGDSTRYTLGDIIEIDVKKKFITVGF